MERRPPPKKQKDVKTGPRRLNGAVLDVDTAATFLGDTPKGTRSKIARGLIPHRRLAGRIILVRSELEQWLGALPGVSASEAIANAKAREAAR